jgi:hypothetical protein
MPIMGARRQQLRLLPTSFHPEDVQTVRKQLLQITNQGCGEFLNPPLNRGTRTEVRNSMGVRRPATACVSRRKENIMARSLTQSVLDYNQKSAMRDEVEMMAGSAGPALRKSAGRLTRYSTGGAQSVGVNSLIGRSRVDGEHSSTLVEEAIKQARRDRELLLQVHSEPECRNVRHVETMRQVHAALIREGSNNALLNMQNESKQMKQSLAEAKSKLRDAIVVQEHLQKKIENHEKERVDLRAAIAFMNHQVASVEQSVHHILAGIDLTLQNLHSHIQRVKHEAQTSLLKVKDQITAEQAKLHMQSMVAESLSARVMVLTGERDASNVFAQRLQAQMSDLAVEYECSKKAQKALHVRHRDIRAKIVEKWWDSTLWRAHDRSFMLWRAQTKEQLYSNLVATIDTNTTSMVASIEATLDSATTDTSNRDDTNRTLEASLQRTLETSLQWQMERGGGGGGNALGALGGREREREPRQDETYRRGTERERAAAEVEAQILETLANDKISFEANSDKMTDKSSRLVSQMSSGHLSFFSPLAS